MVVNVNVPANKAQQSAPTLPNNAVGPTGNTPNPGANYTASATVNASQTGPMKQHPYLTMRHQQNLQSIVGRAPIAEVIKRFRESVEKFDKATLEQRVNIFDIHASESIKISALVFVVTEGQGQTARAAYHTVLLGSTMTRRITQDFTVDGIQFTRVGQPTEGWDSEMFNTVREEMNKRYVGYRLINAAASTLPESFDYSNDSQIQLVVTNATTACQSMLWKTDPGATYLQIGSNFKSTFRTDIKCGWNNQVNLYGSPVRSDVVLELYDTTTEKGNNTNSNNPDSFRINDANAATLVSNITGYVDLIWEPSKNVQAFIPGIMPTQVTDVAAYTPRLVITQLDQIIGPDLVCTLISLATTQALVENERGFVMLMKQHELGQRNTRPDSMDIRDLGALGYDYNPNDITNTASGQKINTREANFTLAALYPIVRALVRSNKFLVSIDIEECGPSSWSQGVFAASASGNVDATKEIINAANVLTGGKFGNIFKGNQVLWDDNYRVNLGYYMDTNGVRRDIRDVDLLSVLNFFGATNISEARDWSNYMSNSAQDIHLRNALSREKIKTMLNAPVFEGYARRYTFNPEFLYALAASISEAGLKYQAQMGSEAPTGGLRAVLPFLPSINNTANMSNAFMNRSHGANMQNGYSHQGIGVFANMPVNNYTTY